MLVKDAMKFLIENRRNPSIVDGGNFILGEPKYSIYFLTNTTDADVPLFIGGANFYMYSLSVPLELIQGDYVDDIGRWNFSPASGYSYSCSLSGGKPNFQLEGPITQTGSKILDNGTPFLFVRDRWGRGDTCCIEINQQVSHVLGLYWAVEKHSWCVRSNLGEILSIVRWEKQDDFNYVTIQKDYLDDYLFLSKSCLVRVFDVSRLKDFSPDIGTERHREPINRPEVEIYAEHVLAGDLSNPAASWLRGFQILRTDERGAVKRLLGTEARQYKCFIINDWRNGKIREWSADPKQLGNYFIESDLPLETSPVFFKAEVLARYQQDPSRFKIGDRRVECHGAWSLQYDINDEGQVHTLISDLGQLPFQEQQYWRSFNEKPKAPISERSFRTDFEGQWDESRDPLWSLKSTIESFPKTDDSGSECPVWKFPNLPITRDTDSLNYVVTDSPLEWELQILRLAQITVEGLNAEYINRIAGKLGVRDKNLQPLRQLERVLKKLQVTGHEIDSTIKPLAEVWKARSERVAHSGKIDSAFDTKKHFREMVEKCDRAMKSLSQLVTSGRLTIR